jgi:hypothetical protein
MQEPKRERGLQAAVFVRENRSTGTHVGLYGRDVHGTTAEQRYVSFYIGLACHFQRPSARMVNAAPRPPPSHD